MPMKKLLHSYVVKKSGSRHDSNMQTICDFCKKSTNYTFCVMAVVSLPLLYPIHHTEGLAVAEKLAFGTVEEVTYFNIGTLILRVGTLEHLLQSGRDVFECHPLTTVGIGLWGANRLLEE